MVSQANRWSLKRITARVLLIPVLAGGAAATAQAQGRATPPAPAAGPVMTQTASSGDPKAILKQGRKALAEGKFDLAQDLARRADASNPSGRWGLFDDTPNSLLKDVQAAVSKAQRAEADDLVKRTRVLLAKPTASEAERAANLDTALQMARRAEKLHGPYSAWEFGDHADKMVKEIEVARSKIRSLPTPPATASRTAPTTPTARTGATPAVATSNPGHSTGIVPASGTRPAAPTATAPAPDAKKTAALKLMAEAKQLADRGDFASANSKYAEAGKIGATFGPNEITPGFAQQELNARGAVAISHLVQDAQGNATKKEYAKAEAALNKAADIAAALSLFSRPIDEAKTALRLASAGQYGGASPVGKPHVGTSGTMPLGTAPVEPPSKPLVAAKPDTASGPLSPAASPAPSPLPASVAQAPAAQAPAANKGTLTGQQLLDAAALEYRKGDFDLAARLARDAFNLGAQDEAAKLLKQIDTDVFAAKQRNAVKSFEAAKEAAANKDHSRALSVLVLIDPKLLPPDLKTKREELIVSCKAAADKASSAKSDSAIAMTGGLQPPGSDIPPLPGIDSGSAGGNAPGTARIGSGSPTDPKAANPDSLTHQADAMRKVTFQKLRSEGLKIQSEAQAAFGRGETDAAIQMLVDYSNRVRAAGLEPASVALLLRPVDGKLEAFRVMKGQTDALAREKRENREVKELIANRGAADEQRKAEVAKLVRQYNALVKESKFAEAERVAMQAKQLEPDDPAIGALTHMATIQRRVREQEQLKSDKERMVYNGLTDAERPGPIVTVEDPLAFNIERTRRNRGRGNGDDSYLRSRTPKEFEIETKLDQPITVEFNQTPLSQVVDNLRELTGLPFSYDTAALEAEAISTAKPITEKLPGLSARNALHLILDKAGLSFVIEYDTIRITTVKKAKGRLVTKVFSVADLVTPVPNFALPDYANFDKMMNRNALNSGQAMIAGLNMPGAGSRGGLGGGVLPGADATSPGIAGNMQFGSRGGSLENQSPLAASGVVTTNSDSKHEQLMKLITGMVRPHSWDREGGSGKIEYFDLGSALVVNQTADVIREIQDLLESLRRLQDLAVAVEVRIISLSEAWYERMGVDFSVNLRTHNTQFEQAVTSQQFRPEPYINSLNGYKGTTVGLTPAGSFTPDLNVPIQATSFQRAIPEFGGYPNMPGNNGGISLGLAFLNDIQVYLFMEAAQGDRRMNVMTAPKLTLFNGQTANLSVNELQFFVTSVQVFSVNGQIVFIPQNTPLPGPGQGGLQISLQAVVSADRRFVRINMPVQMSAQSGATVPLFPVTTFVTPVFEGGSQGMPIPFTQFIQQPSFTNLNIQTTVVCPDGGTVLLGGMKALGESRNEFGPPVLSKIPYLNRLFKNVGIGRQTQHIMIMVTPRIIINSEEEVNQTEGSGALGAGGPPR